MKKILILLLFLTMIGSAHAATNSYSFTDDFSGYSPYYKILSWTNPTSPGVPGILFDANVPITTSIRADSNDAYNVGIDVSLNGSNSGFVDQNTLLVDITDFNALGKLKANVILIDANQANFATINYFAIRIGKNISNYWEYRYNNFSTAGNIGKVTISVDLNSPTSTTGTPTLTDVNWYQVGFVYPATQQDFNFVMNKIWVEKAPNAFNGNWSIVANGSFNQGTILPWTYVNPSGSGMSIFDSNRSSNRNMGIAFIPSFTGMNSTQLFIDMQADLNQIDTNATKLFFNYVDQNNYSSCYIYDINSGGRKIGIEQVTNNVSDFNESDAMFAYNTTQTLRCRTTGTNKNVEAFLNGTLTTTKTITSSIDGEIGIMSFKGRTMVDNYSAVGVLINPPVYLYNTTTNAIADNMLPLFGLVVIAVLILFGLGIGLQRIPWTPGTMMFLFGTMAVLIGTLILAIIFKIVSTTI